MSWESPARAGKGLWGSDTAGCHCCATVLSLSLLCPAIATALPLPCHSPPSVPSVQVSHGHCYGWVAPCSSPCAPFGISCPQVCPLALLQLQPWGCVLCAALPSPEPHRAHSGDSSWTAGMEAGAAEGPLQIQVSECPCVGLSPSTPAASRAGRQNSSPTASPLQCQGSSFLRRCFTC